MLIKTRGIAIKNTKYGETSMISKIYTRQFGMQSFMINGIRSAKAAIKPSLLQPLVLLDMVIYHNPAKNLHRVKELKCHPVLSELHFDIVKSSIGMYMAELLYKTIKEEEPNESLFDFIEGFIINLDTAPDLLSLLPLVFTIRLSGFLGFYPQNDFNETNTIFSLNEGRYKALPENGEEIIELPYSEHFSTLLNENLQFKIPKNARGYLLDKMIDYYKIHIPGFPAMKSVLVLNSVLKEY